MVGAGVLALMPALVRRYDSAVRGQAELENSSMRVLLRERRKRTVPGPVPVNPPSVLPGDRVVGRAAVPDALTPGDPDSETLVREALVRQSLSRDAKDRASRRAAAVASEERARVRARVRRDDPTQPLPAVSGEASDTTRMRHWRQLRRRRVLLAFTVLFIGQLAGVVLIGPGFWIGLGVSGAIMGGYVLWLRSVAAADRRHLAAERARRQRAYQFMREAAAGTRISPASASRAAAWLATPRESRFRPTREIVRVLGVAGREPVRESDGTWLVRRIVAPPRVPVAPRRTAPPVSRPAAARVEQPLPEAVNL